MDQSGFTNLAVLTIVAGQAVTEIVRAVFGAGALIEAGRGEAGVQLCLTHRALQAVWSNPKYTQAILCHKDQIQGK